MQTVWWYRIYFYLVYTETIFEKHSRRFIRNRVSHIFHGPTFGSYGDSDLNGWIFLRKFAKEKCKKCHSEIYNKNLTFYPKPWVGGTPLVTILYRFPYALYKSLRNQNNNMGITTTTVTVRSLPYLSPYPCSKSHLGSGESCTCWNGLKWFYACCEVAFVVVVGRGGRFDRLTVLLRLELRSVYGDLSFRKWDILKEDKNRFLWRTVSAFPVLLVERKE